MRIDVGLIQLVGDNMLSNAVRYGRQKVQVSICEQKDGLTVMVADDGTGFSQKALEKALEPYYHEAGKSGEGEESGRAGENGGEHFGLGLYISKVLCCHHGGCLRIQNTESGGLVTAFFQKS